MTPSCPIACREELIHIPHKFRMRAMAFFHEWYVRTHNGKSYSDQHIEEDVCGSWPVGILMFPSGIGEDVYAVMPDGTRVSLLMEDDFENL